MPHQDPHQFYCDECDAPVKGHDRYCHKCGASLGEDAEQISIFNNSHLQTAFFFYSIYLFVCLAVKYTNWFNTYDTLFWIEVLLAIVTLLFARSNWKTIRPLLHTNTIRWYLVLGFMLLAVAFSSVINITINQINTSIFRTDVNMYYAYRLYQYPVVIMLYSVALVPALFEELAFRGVLYNQLSNILDERLVVIITGFVFAAIHLNFFSLIWLIPFGIFIGNLRRKYQTLWYGMAFHFAFNLTACLFDLYRQGELW